MLLQVSSQRTNHADCQSVVETLWRLQCKEASSDEDDAEGTDRHLKTNSKDPIKIGKGNNKLR